MNNQKRKILFFVESITLAHLTRSLGLAQTLDSQKVEVIFAIFNMPEVLRKEFATYRVIQLKTGIPSKVFTECLAKGTLPHTEDLIEDYIQEDLKLMESIKPDIVIGDFRLSLAISAKMLGIKYVNVTNIYWSPDAKQDAILPELPFTHVLIPMLGESIAKVIATLSRPFIMWKMARPFNKVSKKYGLGNLGNLLDVYTSGDLVLYLDVPELVTMKIRHDNERAIGPVVYSIQNESADWISNAGPSNLPWVYISMGSSGPAHMIPEIMKAIADLPVFAFISTAGRDIGPVTAKNIFVADYLPADLIIQKSIGVICSGGSSNGYQALEKGVPFVAIPGNLDQFQFSQAVSERGAAVLLRPENLSAESIKEAFNKLINQAQYKTAAQQLMNEITENKISNTFPKEIERILG